MKALCKRSLSIGMAMAVLCAAAAPADAITFTPSSTVVTAIATNAQINYGAFGVIRCSASLLTGVTGISGDRVAFRLAFGQVRSPTGCSAFGVEANIICSGHLTLQATSADRRGGGSGTGSLNSDFQCSVTVPGLGSCSITIRGAQGPLNRFVYNSPALSLDLNLAGIRATQDATNRTALCGPASGTSTFSGSYAITTPLNFSIT